MMPSILRHIQPTLLSMLQMQPVVFLNGPRQAGKSTLVQKLAQDAFPADYVTFDNMTQMAAASYSPENYLSNRQRALIIDEVQLVPEIFRPLKKMVDEFRLIEGAAAKGKYLLTGSANIMALPQLSDSLVGRMGVLTLYPFSAAEVLGGKGDFIEKLFHQQFDAIRHTSTVMEALSVATYPEIYQADVVQKAQWFDAYLTTLLQRDVRALSEIQKLSSLPHLLRLLAYRAGGLINDSELARDAGLNVMTVRNYKTLLKMLFLIEEIPAWHRNLTKRLVKAPKGYLVDTSLLCDLLGYEPKHLAESKPEFFGHVFENFVATELLKQLSNKHGRITLSHFRTGDNKEVDFVLENSSGHLVAIEVKKRDNVQAVDFYGLETLQLLAQEDFICGVVLYTGKEVVPFSKKLWAVPVSMLWS